MSADAGAGSAPAPGRRPPPPAAPRRYRAAARTVTTASAIAQNRSAHDMPYTKASAAAARTASASSGVSPSTAAWADCDPASRPSASRSSPVVRRLPSSAVESARLDRSRTVRIAPVSATHSAPPAKEAVERMPDAAPGLARPGTDPSAAELMPISEKAWPAPMRANDVPSRSLAAAGVGEGEEQDRGDHQPRADHHRRQGARPPDHAADRAGEEEEEQREGQEPQARLAPPRGPGRSAGRAAQGRAPRRSRRRPGWRARSRPRSAALPKKRRRSMRGSRGAKLDDDEGGERRRAGGDQAEHRGGRPAPRPRPG